MATHLAAFTPAKGEPFELQTRPTPKPGPNELLIAVKSIALNPADGIMREHGIFIPSYPTVIGFDMSGLVLEVGDNVPTSTDNNNTAPGPVFRPGITRVAAYAGSYWRAWTPDYGAFQERCLVPWQHAVPLPDSPTLSWNQAATLPVAVEVPLNAWDIMGIPRVGETSTPAGSETSRDAAQNSKNPNKTDALLIWGASSSVGTMGVQSARVLREDPGLAFGAVYATAGAANLSYVEELGADRVFDYRDPKVVEAIVAAARADGLVIRYCFLAMGDLAQCQAVLGAFVGQSEKGGEGRRKAKVASAPPVPADVIKVDGVETIFILPSMDEGERLAQFRYWMGTWLRENLAGGNIRPSPVLRVVGKGLGAINAGLDELMKGVSCTKLVVEVAE